MKKLAIFVFLVLFLMLSHVYSQETINEEELMLSPNSEKIGNLVYEIVKKSFTSPFEFLGSSLDLVRGKSPKFVVDLIKEEIASKIDEKSKDKVEKDDQQNNGKDDDFIAPGIGGVLPNQAGAGGGSGTTGGGSSGSGGSGGGSDGGSSGGSGGDETVTYPSWWVDIIVAEINREETHVDPIMEAVIDPDTDFDLPSAEFGETYSAYVAKAKVNCDLSESLWRISSDLDLIVPDEGKKEYSQVFDPDENGKILSQSDLINGAYELILGWARTNLEPEIISLAESASDFCRPKVKVDLSKIKISIEPKVSLGEYGGRVVIDVSDWVFPE